MVHNVLCRRLSSGQQCIYSRCCAQVAWTHAVLIACNALSRMLETLRKWAVQINPFVLLPARPLAHAAVAYSTQFCACASTPLPSSGCPTLHTGHQRCIPVAHPLPALSNAVAAQLCTQVTNGAFLWHGRDLRRMRRALQPPMMHLITCPGAGRLGRGAASLPASALSPPGLASALSTLAEDAAKVREDGVRAAPWGRSRCHCRQREGWREGGAMGKKWVPLPAGGRMA